MKAKNVALSLNEISEYLGYPKTPSYQKEKRDGK